MRKDGTHPGRAQQPVGALAKITDQRPSAGYCHDLLCWISTENPDRKRDARSQRLQAAWWDVDDQPPSLAPGAALKTIGHEADVPVVVQRSARMQLVKGEPIEGAEVGAIEA